MRICGTLLFASGYTNKFSFRDNCRASAHWFGYLLKTEKKNDHASNSITS